MQTFELPPYAPTLIESTRAIGYSLEAAVADIIDNSIAADANHVDLFFFPVDGEYIAILDNGSGMNANELNSAMQYGSKSPNEVRKSNDLGRFGLGLKTASLSQCRKLTVVTKQGQNIMARCWDVDFVASTGKWTLLILDEEEINNLPHITDLKQYENGTLVLWQHLDRLKAGEINFEQSLGRKIDLVRSHLSLVFHRYLTGESGIKKLSISINNTAVEPADPFLSKKSNQPMDDETLIVRGEKISVRPYILPHISKMSSEEICALGGKDGLRRQQGFYIYRNKRLLVWGTWFRMMRQAETSKLVRIRVDIPNALDDLWTLDIKKSSAIPPAEVRMNLKSVVDKLADTSKKTWTFRGKRETDDSIVHVWNRLRTRNGGFIYEINRDHPLVQECYNQDAETERKVNILLSQIEENLPLNSLFLDLTNDEKIENDKDLDYREVIKMMHQILETTDASLHEAVVDTLICSEPFVSYSSEIKKAFEEGNLP